MDSTAAKHATDVKKITEKQKVLSVLFYLDGFSRFFSSLSLSLSLRSGALLASALFPWIFDKKKDESGIPHRHTAGHTDMTDIIILYKFTSHYNNICMMVTHSHTHSLSALAEKYLRDLPCMRDVHFLSTQ